MIRLGGNRNNCHLNLPCCLSLEGGDCSCDPSVDAEPQIDPSTTLTANERRCFCSPQALLGVCGQAISAGFKFKFIISTAVRHGRKRLTIREPCRDDFVAQAYVCPVRIPVSVSFDRCRNRAMSCCDCARGLLGLSYGNTRPFSPAPNLGAEAGLVGNRHHFSD